MNIKFEQELIISPLMDKEDEMHGDQLLGHPVIKEIQILRDNLGVCKTAGNKLIDNMYHRLKRDLKNKGKR